MEGLTLLLIALVVLAAVWVRKSQRKDQRVSHNGQEQRVDEYRQAIIDSAQRIVHVVNESLKIANESKNADTKVSRLGVAKMRIAELKQLSIDHPFISIKQLAQVEQSISELELEFVQAHYREAAEGNMSGRSLENEGNIDEAILVYERLLEEGVDTPFTYRRLAIIYSKRKERDEELRVLRAAIKNVPIENSAHYRWFAERLAKRT